MPADHTTAPCPLDLGPLGCIEGLTVSNKSSTLCHYFGGLPYALPPVGPYRFRRARPLPDFFRYGTKANPGRFAGGTGVCPQPGYRGNPDKSLWDEDCLQLNIYIPTGDAPKEGWPVFFFIHGGWLQFGNPNTAPKAMAPLLSETQFRAVIVQPAYRLNAFGFLACKELQWEAEGDGDTVGNLGFWDQRMALEWVKSNINRFGGDAENITVGGLSAGAHSTFQQLAHDLYLPDSKSIIKRAIMFSNGSGVQPKSLSEHQTQFDELLNALRIPLHLSGPEKLAALRKLPSDELVDIQSKLKYSEFRALSDGAFVSGSLIHDINTGAFAQRMRRRGVRLLIGECRDEHFVYGSWRPPLTDSYDAVLNRLEADYPRKQCERLMRYYSPDGKLPADCKDWADCFGRLYADMQVHCLERGFVDKLTEGGLRPGRDVLRYRIEWRAKCVDAFLPPEWKVTHSTDMSIWFWGNGWGEGLTEDEKVTLKPLNALFASFVKGDDVQWEKERQKKTVVKRLNEKGQVDWWDDVMWEEGVEVWNLVNGDERTKSTAKL